MLVFADCRIPAAALQSLQGLGYTVLLCPAHPKLDSAIASHPDMLLFPTKCGLLTHRDYTVPDCPLPQIPIDRVLGGTYPEDVLLNAAKVGKYLVCRPDATASELLAYAKQNGVTVLPVRQGYAKCNTCIVSDNAVITEDASIASALTAVGIDVLRITAGHVALPGYPYGFIGGASGSDGHRILFCGDLAKHPDGARISDFCLDHGKQPISLCDQPLLDVGSLLFCDSTTQQ